MYYLVPESLVGQRISQGTIIDALQHNISGSVWVWIVEYADGRTCQHTIEDVTEGMQRYYNNGGIGKDFVNYFLNDKRQYQTSEVKRLCSLVDQLDDIGDVDDLVLSILKLEQVINRSSKRKA